MWEQIRLNRRKTVIFWVLSGVFFFLLALGFAALFGPELEYKYGLPRSSIFFLLVGTWVVLSFVSYFYGDSLLLKISQARKVDRDVNPRLFNIVEEMQIAANLPDTPEVYIIPSLSTNAFSTGIRPHNSSIVVTAGLLSQLNREELEAVIAHEMSHIINRDVLLLTFLGTVLGAFTIVGLLLFVVLSGGRVRFSNGRRTGRYREYHNRRSGEREISLGTSRGVSGIIFYSLLSKTREYLADATAVRLTRNPGGLASALEKIDRDKNRLEVANSITAPMYIETPLKAKGTHPPIYKRKKILMQMDHGAHYGEYQRVYRMVTGESGTIIPRSVLKEDEHVPIKEQDEVSEDLAIKEEGNFDVRAVKRKGYGDNEMPFSEVEPDGTAAEENAEGKESGTRERQFLDCRCGIKIEIPAGYKHDHTSCPRCGRIYSSDTDRVKKFNTRHFNAINFIKGVDELPVEQVNVVERDEDGVAYYVPDNPEGWESFVCECGDAVQLSPGFSRDFIKCDDCGLKIVIRREEEDGESGLAKLKKDNMGLHFITRGDEWKRFHCECGNLLRLSPHFAGSFLTCRECGEKISVREEEGEASQDEKASADVREVDGEAVYNREGGWETFNCLCGNTLQLSPDFAPDAIECDACGREIGLREN